MMSDILQDGMKPVSLEVRSTHLQEAWRLMAEAFSSMGAARFDHQCHSVVHSMVRRMVHRLIHQQLPPLDCSMPVPLALVPEKVNMPIFM